MKAITQANVRSLQGLISTSEKVNEMWKRTPNVNGQSIHLAEKTDRESDTPQAGASPSSHESSSSSTQTEEELVIEIEELHQTARELAVDVESSRIVTRYESDGKINALDRKARGLAKIVEASRIQAAIQADEEIKALRDQAKALAAVVEQSRIRAVSQSGNEISKLNDELEQRVVERTGALNASVRRLADSENLLKKKNRRLARLCRMANEFVNNVSHEFRTPLTVIKEYASLVKDGVAGPVSDQQKEMLSVVDDRADELNRMVDDMLDVSKLDAGLLGVYRQKCDVLEIIASVRTTLESKARVRGVQLEIEVEPHLPPVFCDCEKAGRVLINLSTNAIKFCGTPGHVRVECHREPNRTGVKFSVTDNGNGISADDQQTIFDRFMQLSETASSGTKGYGLGLNIAKELVEVNLGELSVTSEPGSGATFSFTLPPDDPRQVLKRYLDRLEYFRNGSSHICLIRAETEQSARPSFVDDLDTFWRSQLLPSVLIFPVGGAEWLIILPVFEPEIAAFIKQIETAITTTNRNRPGEPLPEIRLKEVGSWSVKGNKSEILDELSAAFDDCT